MRFWGKKRKRTDDWDAIERGNRADVVGSSDGASNGRLLLLGTVFNALAGKVGSTTLACLQAIQLSTFIPKQSSAEYIHDGGLGVAGSLQSSNDGAAGGDVASRDGEALLTSVGEQLQHIIACLGVNITARPMSAEELAP